MSRVVNEYADEYPGLWAWMIRRTDPDALFEKKLLTYCQHARAHVRDIVNTGGTVCPALGADGTRYIYRPRLPLGSWIEYMRCAVATQSNNPSIVSDPRAQGVIVFRGAMRYIQHAGIHEYIDAARLRSCIMAQRNPHYMTGLVSIINASIQIEPAKARYQVMRKEAQV